jgi:hypothetical protein
MWLLEEPTFWRNILYLSSGWKNLLVFLLHMLQLLVTANVAPSLLILFTLLMEAISSSETSILTRDTWHHIPEGMILLYHCRENIKSYSNHLAPKFTNVPFYQRKNYYTDELWLWTWKRYCNSICWFICHYFIYQSYKGTKHKVTTVIPSLLHAWSLSFIYMSVHQGNSTQCARRM